MKKAILRIVTGIVIMGLLLVSFGCSDSNNNNDANKTGNNENNEVIENVKLELWDIGANPEDAGRIVNEEAMEVVKNQYPNYEINVNYTDGDTYKTKIKTAVAANEMPDVFYTWLPGWPQSFVEAGKILKLDDYLSQETFDSIHMSVLNGANGSFDGTYALPFDILFGVLYCNKALFDENGIDLPKSYDELLLAIKKFNENGIKPIIAPGKRIWPVMWTYDILALQTAGAQKSMDALNKKISFDDEEFLEAAKKLKELVDNGAFVEGSLGIDNPEANAEFLNGNVPMYFMGSWMASSIEADDSKVKGDIVPINYPATNDVNSKHMLGGPATGYMVSANTEHKEESVKVLELYTKSKAENVLTAFPAWDVEKDMTGRPAIFKELDKLYKDADQFVIWWDTYLNGDDAELHKNASMELFAGVKTPEEFIEEMKIISER